MYGEVWALFKLRNDAADCVFVRFVVLLKPPAERGNDSEAKTVDRALAFAAPLSATGRLDTGARPPQIIESGTELSGG